MRHTFKSISELAAEYNIAFSRIGTRRFQVGDTKVDTLAEAHAVILVGEIAKAAQNEAQRVGETTGFSYEKVPNSPFTNVLHDGNLIGQVQEFNGKYVVQLLRQRPQHFFELGTASNYLLADAQKKAA